MTLAGSESHYLLTSARIIDDRHEPNTKEDGVTVAPRMLRIDETSELTTLPVSTLRYLRHLGEGPPAFRLGRRLVYDQADVLAWIAERKAADPALRQRAG
jgi:prophage regulatory protein